MPQDGAAVVDMVVEGFGSDVEFRGVTFNSVKIFHPKKGMLSAPPNCIAESIFDNTSQNFLARLT